MLDAWLGGISVSDFSETYLGRRPVAVAGSAIATTAFDWTAFGRVLATAKDVLVVAAGERLRRPAPRTLGKLVEGFRVGHGLALRQTETLDPELARIHAGFETSLGPAHVQLFATAGGSYGFGWHYDDEDVFIVQTAGVKDYYFRENTVGDLPAHPAQFARYTEETSQLCTAVLTAGDFLYIPARWWHMALCREHALSISVGVYPSRARKATETG